MPSYDWSAARRLCEAAAPSMRRSVMWTLPRQGARPRNASQQRLAQVRTGSATKTTRPPAWQTSLKQTPLGGGLELRPLVPSRFPREGPEAGGGGAPSKAVIVAHGDDEPVATLRANARAAPPKSQHKGCILLALLQIRQHRASPNVLVP